MVSGLARQGIRPRTVIDIGANVGQYAVAALKLLPIECIHCFEPQPDCAEQLRRNLLVFPRANVHQIALGDELGTLDFHINSHSHSSSVLRLSPLHQASFPHAINKSVITVQVSTVDTVLGDSQLPDPVLMKIDVQGYESKVLKGASSTLRRVKYVIAETSFKPLYEGELLFRELLKIMEEYGFRFLRPVGWLQNDRTKEYLQMDALFGRED
jgi:FkbM family methyltransferase